MTSMTPVEALLAATTRTADALERIEKLLQRERDTDAPVKPSPPTSDKLDQPGAPPPPAAWVKGSDALRGQPADNAAPWYGGNNAPNDWDGRAVWFRNGQRVESVRTHYPYSWSHGENSGDIMWYSRSSPAAMTDADKIARLRSTLQHIASKTHNEPHLRVMAIDTLQETK